MTGLHPQAPAAIAGAIGFGMVFAILGNLKEFLLKKGPGSGNQTTGCVSYGHLIFIPSVFLTGLVADYWSPQGLVITGSLLAGLGLFGLTYGRVAWMTWTALIAAAAGAASMISGAIVLFPSAFFDNKAAAASANLGFVFCSLGGLAVGSLAPLTIQKLDFRRGLSILAVLCLIPAFVAALFPIEDSQSLTTEIAQTPLWTSPVLWLVALAFCLYSPIEGSLSAWATHYLTQMGYSERQAGWLVSGYWLTFIASRLAAAYFAYYYVHEGGPWVLITLALLSAVAIGGLAGTRQPAHSVFWLFLIGLVLGPIFPNLIGILYRQFGEGEIGTAYGTVILLGGGLSLIFPPFMSAFAERNSLRVALRVPIVISIILACGGLALVLSN
jgi:cyanate permease